MFKVDDLKYRLAQIKNSEELKSVRSLARRQLVNYEAEDVDWGARVLDDLEIFVNDSTSSSRVYALVNGSNEYEVVFFAVWARQKGAKGITLRVRYILFMPKWSCGEGSMEQYAGLWGELFYQIVAVLAYKPLKAERVKIYTGNSSGDWALVKHFRGKWAKKFEFSERIKDVKIYGGWLDFSVRN